MAFLLALDQGTSSSRAILFDAAGRVLAAAQRGFDQLFPHDGWVEQPPEMLWTTTLTAGREAIAKSGVRPADIAAIGIANQRETTLVWDARSGTTVGNAIVWQDRRTAARCQRMLLEGMEAELVDATGLLVDPYFSPAPSLSGCCKTRQSRRGRWLASSSSARWTVFSCGA